MPTEVISTIRASGGDYTTLSAWEAGEQRNLVTADEIAVAVCYNDWPSGLNNSFTVAGWTTDAARYVKITVAEGHRHNGTPGTGFRVVTNTTVGVTLSARYTHVEWVEVENTNFAFDEGADDNVFRNVIAIAGGSGNCYGARTGDKFICCLAIGGGFGFRATNEFRSFTATNCVAVGTGVGFRSATFAAATVKNCVAYSCTTDYQNAFASGTSNNASSATGSPGDAPLNSITSAAFVNAAANDFHLSTGSVLRGAGVNLYSDFTHDIDGDEWPSSGAWDIGFDYYVAAGGSLTINSITASNITQTGATITLGLTR